MPLPPPPANAQITLASYPGSIGKGRRPTVKVLQREWGKTKMGLDDSPVQQARSRIIIADDHPLFRSAIRHTLEGHTDLEVVADAANGREAMELCRRLRPELVLMDLQDARDGPVGPDRPGPPGSPRWT